MLTATVPFDAPYKAMHRLDIAAVTINDQLVECADDDALHIVGYLGDANGNMTYELDDIQQIQRMAIRYSTGFTAWENISPLIIADIDGNGLVTSTDASRVYQELAGYDSKLIPDIPSAAAFQLAAEQRNTQQTASPATGPSATANGETQPTVGTGATDGTHDGNPAPSQQEPSPSTPTVRFNGGLLDFGIGKPVNNNDWMVSWVTGSSRPAGNDWKLLLP